MISDDKCLKFISFVGAIVSTGLRGIIKDMMKNKWFDVGLTTCGALDHDIARHFSHYNEGSFTMDDMELANQHIHRLGNVLVPMDSYGPLIEEKMTAFLEEEYAAGVREMNTAEICKMIGCKVIATAGSKENFRKVVPGIMDGAVGNQIWMFSQSHGDFKLNLFGDYEDAVNQWLETISWWWNFKTSYTMVESIS